MAAEKNPPHPLGAAVIAGLCLFVADGLASGLLRTPWPMHVLSFGLWLLVGLAAGLVAMGSRGQGVGLGLVLAAGAGLNSLSLVTKQLEPEQHAPLGGAVALLSVLAGLACVGGQRTGSSRFLVLASIPISSLLVGLFGASSAKLLLAAGLPLLAALLTRWSRWQASRASTALPCNLVLVALLVLPVALKERPLERADLTASDALAPAEAPDLLLLIIDTMRADSLGDSGPLAQLAAGGVRFEQCISTAPWTLPSVSSILTGLLPSQHGATRATRVLPQDVETLAERLRASGYQTAAFTGGAFVSPAFQLDQGFEHFDASAEFGFRPFSLHVPLVWRLVKNRFFPLWSAINWVGEYPGFEGVCQSAGRWLDEREGTRPYFMLLHTYEMHDYYLAHGSVDANISADESGLSARFQGRLSVHPEELVGASQADLEHFERIYKNRLVHIELVLEAFLTRTERSSKRQRVLAIVSDHGEGFDSGRGRVHHGGRLHEDQLRVPLIFHAPGMLPEGSLIQSPVSSIDLAPTLLEMAGLSPPAELPGSSLLELMRGAAPAPRATWSEERSNGRSMFSLRAEGWKLLREAGQDQYFDLSQDPEEDRLLNAAPDHLRRRLSRFEEEFPPRIGESSKLDADTRAHLRNIGYLGDQDEED